MTQLSLAEFSEVTARPLRNLAEWTAASLLYREVFAYQSPEHAVSPYFLAALLDNGGSAIGAFTEDTLVGFCYGVSAIDNGEIYHYSQAAVVAQEAQGKGVGRLLKTAQAGVAREQGATSMRWAFDPYKLHNAHFNLNVLGASGIIFKPDFYGTGHSDRVIVRWNFKPRSQVLQNTRSVTVPTKDGFAAPEPHERQVLRNQFLQRFARNEILVGVTQVTPHETAYAFQDHE